MGNEYGFYIRTIKLQYNYRSYVAVYDVDYTTPNYFSHTSSCNIQMVFNCWYDGMYRESDNPLGNMIVGGKDKAVVYLACPTSNSDKVFLTDVSTTISVENRDYPNPGDSGYGLIDYSNMNVIDKGDFILSQTCKINPQIIPQSEIESDPEFLRKIITFGLKKIISETKVLSPLLWLEYLDIEPAKIMSDYYFNIVRYGTEYDQLILDEEFIRTGTCKSNSDYISYNPIFHTGNYFEMTTDLDGSFNPEERRIMNLDYDLSVSIYDPSAGTTSTALKSRHFEYTKYMKVTNTDELYSASIDNGIGTTAFYYHSLDNNPLQLLHYSGAKLQANVFDTKGNLIDVSEDYIYINSPGERGYIIIFSGNSETVAFAPCKDRSKFMDISLDSKKSTDLSHNLTNFIFSIEDVGVREYAFFLECDELIGVTFRIADIYGNIIVGESEITRKQTYIKSTLTPNTIYNIEIIKNNSGTKKINLIVFELFSEYTLTMEPLSTTNINYDNGESYTYKIESPASKYLRISADSQSIIDFYLFNSNFTSGISSKSDNFIDYLFIKNEVYYLRIFSDESLSFNISISYEEVNNLIVEDNDYSNNVYTDSLSYVNDFNVYQFTPTISKKYKLELYCDFDLNVIIDNTPINLIRTTGNSTYNYYYYQYIDMDHYYIFLKHINLYTIFIEAADSINMGDYMFSIDSGAYRDITINTSLLDYEIYDLAGMEVLGYSYGLMNHVEVYFDVKEIVDITGSSDMQVIFNSIYISFYVEEGTSNYFQITDFPIEIRMGIPSPVFPMLFIFGELKDYQYSPDLMVFTGTLSNISFTFSEQEFNVIKNETIRYNYWSDETSIQIDN